MAEQIEPISLAEYPSFPWASDRESALDYLRKEATSTDGWEKFGGI